MTTPTFEITASDAGEVVLAGRLDTAHAEAARDFFAGRPTPSVIDVARLEFIASAGLGVLLVVQKRAMQAGHTITLVNVNENVRTVLRHAGFDRLFGIL